MDTIVKKITEDSGENAKLLAEAGAILARGGLVAFPTETVYGLGGDAFDATAAERIYAAKGRPSDNPLIVHIAEVLDLSKLSDEVPEVAYRLAEAFWPGPLTMIVKKNEAVPRTVTGGLDTVAVRLPSHPVAREMIRQSGTFIAAPSANLSGRPSPTTAKHVVDDLTGRVDMIIDAGAIEIGLESTIVDLTGPVPMVLRPGYITQKMLSEVVGEVQLDPALMVGVKGDVKPKAPGMKYRHYAPKAELTVVESESNSSDSVIRAMAQLTDQALLEGKKVGLMLSKEYAEKLGEKEGVCYQILGSSANEDEIAHNLFAALRSFDNAQVEVIYSEGFSMEGIGQAIMNRLLKAAGQKILRVE